MLSIEQKENYQNRRVDIIRLFNSTLFFIASIVIVNLVREGALYLYCLSEGTVCEEFGKGVYYSSFVPVFFYLIKPLSSFLLGWGFVIAYRLRMKKAAFRNMFFLWGAFLSFVYVLIELLILNFNLHFGLGGIVMRYSLSVLWLVASNVVLMVGVVVLSRWVAHRALAVSNSKSRLLKAVNRRGFLNNVLLFPAIIGSLIVSSMYFSFLKDEKIYLFPFVVALLVLAQFFVGEGFYKKVQITRYPTSDKLQYVPAFFLVVLYVFLLVF